jgi:hypothetical protein
MMVVYAETRRVNSDHNNVKEMRLNWTKLRGLSPRMKYTDRATAAFRRS